MSYLLGIDIGTTGTKAALFTPDGRLVASAAADHPLAHPRPRWAEQAPEDWWQAALAAIRAVLARAGVPARAIGGIGLSGQMHGAVLLDAAGAVLRPCIIWSDQRTQAECDEITATVGEQRLAEWVANPALPGFTAPKLLWVRRHEPRVWERVRTVLLPKDYLRYRLTGELAQEISDAAGTLLFDVRRRRWSTELLAALALPAELLPPWRESAAICGRVTPAAAAATGLAAGTPVVGGGADNACAAAGNGVVDEGRLLVSIGTSGTVVAPLRQPLVDPGQRAHTFNHAAPAIWYLMGVMQAAGLSLRWLRDLLGPDDAGYEALTAAAATVPPGAEGLLWLPYLQGERTPHRDPYARGVLFGVTPRHGRGHVARAVLEGVTYGLRDSVEIIRAAGVRIDAVYLTGGGARSPLWRQIVADVLGLPLMVAQEREGPAFGAALLAAVGTGHYASLAEASAATLTSVATATPDPARQRAYAAAYAEFRALYPPLRERFRAAAALDG
jgi:xylulokinase